MSRTVEIDVPRMSRTVEIDVPRISRTVEIKSCALAELFK
jgi:hypothetical protein